MNNINKINPTYNKISNIFLGVVIILVIVGIIYKYI